MEREQLTPPMALHAGRSHALVRALLDPILARLFA